MKHASLILPLLLLAAPPTRAAERLTLGEYLDQVASSSPAVAAGKLRAQASPLRAGAAGTLTFPYLFGSLGAYDDESETAFPGQQGTGTDGSAYTIGVGMVTPYGLSGRYTWNTSYSNTTGVPLSSGGRYTSYNKIDLTMSLMRNGFGSETRARQALTRAGSSALGLSGRYLSVSTLAEAEAAYWRLALARQAVQVQRDALDRAERLLQWARRRVSLQLGDRSDLLQAQASHELHNIELSGALEEERGSARAFNLLRNREGDSAPEAVGFPSVEETLRREVPARQGERLDVQAAAERTKAAQAQAQLDKEQLKPSLDLAAAYSWNGREPQRSGALSEALGSKHPARQIALTFSVPLDVPAWTKALRGADQEMEAAAYELEQARLQDRKGWNDLSSRLREARARLKLAAAVEGLQHDKFENEQRRLQRGRSTTFQALTFEQDYASAQLMRLRAQAEVLQLIAQMKSYRGDL